MVKIVPKTTPTAYSKSCESLLSQRIHDIAQRPYNRERKKNGKICPENYGNSPPQKSGIRTPTMDSGLYVIDVIWGEKKIRNEV